MSSGLKDFSAGCVGGMFQVLSGHPLDTLKVRLQTSGQFNGMIDCATKTIRAEGIAGLYKGMSSPLIGVSFINAMMFLSYGTAQRTINSFHGRKENATLSLSDIFFCGLGTGFAVAFVEGPFDLFKAKLQVQYAGTDQQYKNAVDVARKLAMSKGIRGIYQGLAPTILRNLPGNASYFFVYEYFKRMWTKDGELSSAVVLTAGGLGGMGYWVACFPFDVMKSKMQTDAVEKSARKYKSVMDCASQIMAKEGLGGFFRGFAPAMVRSFPANATCFLGYEYSKMFLNKYL